MSVCDAPVCSRIVSVATPAASTGAEPTTLVPLLNVTAPDGRTSRPRSPATARPRSVSPAAHPRRPSRNLSARCSSSAAAPPAQAQLAVAGKSPSSPSVGRRDRVGAARQRCQEQRGSAVCVQRNRPQYGSTLAKDHAAESLAAALLFASVAVIPMPFNVSAGLALLARFNVVRCRTRKLTVPDDDGLALPSPR